MEAEEAMAINTIPGIFTESVEKYGERTALRKKELGLWHDISWQEYYRRAKHIALGLFSLGFRKGDRVSIIGDNCPEWVTVDMAVLSAGGVTAGVYSTNSWDQCQYVVENSGSKFYFVENEEQVDKWLEFRESVPDLEKVIVWDMKGLRDFKDPMVISFDELMETGAEVDRKQPGLMEKLMAAVTPEDTAILIYTSGTTGRPKGAMLTHENCTWISGAIVKANPLLETDEVLSYLPLCHIFERIFSVLTHIRFGYIVNFIENVDTVTDNMKEISPTVGYAVPRIWEKYHSMVVITMSDATFFKRMVFNRAMAIGQKRVRKEIEGKKIPVGLKILYQLAHFAVFRKLKERMGFERLRLAYSGAAPISPEVITFFNAIGINLIEGYGQTEATGVTTLNRLGKAEIGTVGLPIDGVELKIADDGEIQVKSPGVFKGYYKDPEITELTLRDGWLLTGDVGIINEKGNLTITGRKKDIIITAGGKNITPQYIEGKIIFSPYVNDAIVIGDQKKYLTSIIVLDEENVVKYAQDNKIQFSTYTDLTKNEEIIKLIQAEIDRVNKELARVEEVKKFTILPHKLYQEDGDVTPTMKVKRSYMQEKYSDLIDRMY